MLRKLEQLKSQYSKDANILLRKEATFGHHRDELASLKEHSKLIEHQLGFSEKVLNLAQLVAEAVRVQTKEAFVTLVTAALQAVFTDILEFRLELSTKRGKSAIDFQVALTQTDGSVVILDPLDAFGGSVSYLIAMILRISLCILYKVDGPIFLDEPTKGVDSEHNARVGAFLTELSKRLNRQIIVVTHEETLAEQADTVLAVTKDEGISKVSTQAELLFDNSPTTREIASTRVKGLQDIEGS